MKHQTLNPEWNEEFQLKVYAKDQPILFKARQRVFLCICIFMCVCLCMCDKPTPHMRRQCAIHARAND